jgi:hypothetical protein
MVDMTCKNAKGWLLACARPQTLSRLPSSREEHHDSSAERSIYQIQLLHSLPISMAGSELAV